MRHLRESTIHHYEIGNPEPGWQTIGTRFNDQWYWNGQEWTGHRRWIAWQWVEDSPDP